MRPGDLVIMKEWADWPSMEVTQVLGIVIRYKPHVMGGSYMVSWVNEGTRSHGTEVRHDPVRGEVLIISCKDGGYSWYDELNLELVSGDLRGV